MISVRQAGDEDKRSFGQKMTDSLNPFDPSFAKTVISGAKAPNGKHLPTQVFAGDFGERRGDSDAFANAAADAILQKVFGHRRKLGENTRFQQNDLFGTGVRAKMIHATARVVPRSTMQAKTKDPKREYAHSIQKIRRLSKSG